MKENGVTLLPKIFSTNKVDMARHALWEVIQGDYETGLEPESRFWNVGDDIQKIIKIDKPHLCNIFQKLRIQKKSKYGILRQFGSLLEVEKKDMPVGTEMLNIGHFGEQKVYSLHGLHFQMSK